MVGQGVLRASLAAKDVSEIILLVRASKGESLAGWKDLSANCWATCGLIDRKSVV